MSDRPERKRCRHEEWVVDGRYWRCAYCGRQSLSAIPQGELPWQRRVTQETAG